MLWPPHEYHMMQTTLTIRVDGGKVILAQSDGGGEHERWRLDPAEALDIASALTFAAKAAREK